MWKAALVGALALAMVGLLPVGGQSLAGEEVQLSTPLTEGHIARLKNVLRLTSTQEPLWAPVEGALRNVVRQQSRSDDAGVAQRLSNRASAAAVNAVALRRLVAVAMPLIKVLDDQQRRDAMTFARSVGFDSLAAVF